MAPLARATATTAFAVACSGATVNAPSGRHAPRVVECALPPRRGRSHRGNVVGDGALDRLQLCPGIDEYQRQSVVVPVRGGGRGVDPSQGFGEEAQLIHCRDVGCGVGFRGHGAN
ncbi:MAG: hypothetical protein QOH82_4217 [Mycobacterium sp.]|nr:hypothetical protein [Mycobacterium sp.]